MSQRTDMFLLSGGVLGFAALLGLISLGMAWYVYNIRISGGFGTPTEGSVDFGLFGGTMRLPMGTGGAGGPFSYTAGNPCNCPAVGSTMLAVFGVTLVGAIMTLLAVGMAFMTARPKMAVGLAAVVGGFALIVAPLLLTATLPDAFGAGVPGAAIGGSPHGPWEGFTGTTTFTNNTGGFFTFTTTLTWGPGAGWYVSLANGIIALAGAVFAVRAKPRPARPPLPPVYRAHNPYPYGTQVVYGAPPPGYGPYMPMPYGYAAPPPAYWQPPFQPPYGPPPIGYPQPPQAPAQRGPQPPPPQAPPTPDVTVYECPRCKGLVAKDAAACGTCGQPFGQRPAP